MRLRLRKLIRTTLGPRRTWLAHVIGVALLSSWHVGAASAQMLVSSGSGFLVNETGWVLTNAHVVEGCDAVREETLGQAASVIESDDTDLALVLFRGLHSGEPLPLREAPARLTEDVVALGFPLSDILGNGIRATTGTVSSLSGIQGDQRFIQISAPIQPGNSGGPVLDRDGNVIGVATATISEDAYSQSQNVNFAVTARDAATFVSGNGLSYVTAPTTPSEDRPGDLVERATASTYLLQCWVDEPALSPDQPLAPPSSDPAPALVSGRRPGMITYGAMDVLGFDYRTIRDATADGCQASCEADADCRAFTFNVPHGVCFLKSDAIVLVENEDAIGGYDDDLADDVVDSGLVVTSGVDAPGGDYRRIRGSDFVECTLECGVDLQCQAFAFVRESGDCWLKDHVGPLQSMPGVEFGLRR